MGKVSLPGTVFIGKHPIEIHVFIFVFFRLRLGTGDYGSDGNRMPRLVKETAANLSTENLVSNCTVDEFERMWQTTWRCPLPQNSGGYEQGFCPESGSQEKVGPRPGTLVMENEKIPHT